MKKIAIIGANEPLIPHYVQTKKLGYEIHSFAWEEGAVCKKYADFFYPISFTDKESILAECRKIKIDGIVSFTLESALSAVNYVAQELNLSGNPQKCIIATSNKYEMRKRLKKIGLKNPYFKLIKSENELSLVNLDFPLIVKPVDSGGSRGVTKVDNEKDLLKAYKRALSYSKSRHVIVEKYIYGREFSVEYISHMGKHYFLTITDKVTSGEPYYVELEHHQPAFISDELKNKIKTITEQTLSGLYVSSSASHTEIKLDNKGDLYIIEVGARMAGDMIGYPLLSLSTGYDYVKGILELAIGDFNVPVFGLEKFSGIYYLSAERKNVETYIENSERYPDIISKEPSNGNIIKVKESLDRAGYFIYQSKQKFNLSKSNENRKK